MKKVSLLILVSMILLLAFTSCDMLPESVAGPLNDAKETVLGWFGIEQSVEHEHVWTDATCESPKTCECGETDGEALGHTWTDATCQAPKTCSVCSKTEGNALKHEWEAASCETPATCKLCGEISGEALGHTWIDATCTNAKYCVECNKTEGTASGHDWMEATCVIPKTCKVCAATEGVAKGHTWDAADCENPETCLNCGATEGECIGHNWTEATCVLPEICLNCGEIQGEALGHNYADATCEAPQTCSGCGHTKGSPLGHEWTEATCVTPSECTTCGKVSEVDATGHDYADATCVLPKTCKLCGGTEGEALGHVGGTATCNTLAVCDVCSESYGEYDGHNIVTTDATFTCSKCNVSFSVVSEGVYFNGDNMTGTTIGSYTGTNIGNYVGTGSAYNGGANKVVSENGVWKAITDEARVDGTDAAGTTQMQVWLPQIKTGFKEFNAGNKSIGAMSFKLKLDLSYAKDVFSVLLHNSNGWNPENGIRTNVLDIQPIVAEGVVTGYKANVWVDNSRTTVELPVTLVDGGSATEWFEVQMFFVMDSENDVVTTYYYIDGAFLASGSYENTVDGDALSCVYINLNAWNAGSGYYMDDILFGHTKNSHYVFDNQSHVVTPATCTEPETCSCGLTQGEALGHDWADATCVLPKTCKTCGDTDGKPLGHNLVISSDEEKLSYTCSACNVSFVIEEYKYFNGAAANDFVFTKNGGFAININEAGQYEAFFAPTTAAPGSSIVAGDSTTTEEKDESGNKTGWYEYTDSGKAGSQHMFWIPSNGAGKGLQGFSCANNATGVIAFKMQTNVDTAFNVSAAKERGAADWTGWGTSEIKLLNVGAYSEDGIVLKGGFNAGTELVTIPAKDGWSEMFDVKIFIQLKDDNTITAHYYINAEYVGTFSGDMTIDSGDIRALYINGWTYTANTGIIMDDIVMGYTTEAGHFFFDGQNHDVSEATCTEPEQCSCGYVLSPALGHTNGKATCTEDAKCSVCGEVAEKALGHSLAVSGYDATATTMIYACVNNCGASYNLAGHYFDGTETFTNASGDTASYTGDNSNGYYDYFNKSDAPSNAQAQLWVPSNVNNPDTLADFSCENNAFGVFAFKIKPNNTDGDIEFIFAERRNGSNWSGWGPSDINVLNINKIADGSVTIKGGIDNYNTNFGTVSLSENDGWIDIALMIQLTSEKKITINVLVNGKYAGTATGAMDIHTGILRSVYIKSSNTTKGAGFAIDDIVFACTTEKVHFQLDGQAHEKSDATCTEAEKCSCGYVYASAKGHTAEDATCTEDAKCSVCGEVAAKATGHNLTGSAWDAAKNTFVYSCANGCGESYNLTGYYADGTDKNNLEVVNNGVDYVLTINEQGQYEMISPDEDGAAKGQQQIWVPLKGTPALLNDFSCANNSVGFLSFKVNAKNVNNNGLQFKLNAERETGAWSGGPNKDGWTDCSFAVLDIEKISSENQTTAKVTGYKGVTVAVVELDADQWTGWLDIAIKIELHDDNTMTLTYYYNGVAVATVTETMPIYTYRINSVYITGKTNAKGTGFKFDDLAFGYVAPEKFYNSEIAAENVTSETLKTIVDSKFKQCDQCTTVNAQGGTPVYVLADKDGAEVEALYVSRTYAWAGTEAEQFTEFRFALDSTKKVTSFSFDYKIEGTVEDNTRYTFYDPYLGETFQTDAYVQVKTVATHVNNDGSTEDYPELKGTDLVLDGEWHTMSYTFATPEELKNILLNLYHFQGEMLISNLVINYAE